MATTWVIKKDGSQIETKQSSQLSYPLPMNQTTKAITWTIEVKDDDDCNDTKTITQANGYVCQTPARFTINLNSVAQLSIDEITNVGYKTCGGAEWYDENPFEEHEGRGYYQAYICQDTDTVQVSCIESQQPNAALTDLMRQHYDVNQHKVNSFSFNPKGYGIELNTGNNIFTNVMVKSSDGDSSCQRSSGSATQRPIQISVYLQCCFLEAVSSCYVGCVIRKKGGLENNKYPSRMIQVGMVDVDPISLSDEPIQPFASGSSPTVPNGTWSYMKIDFYEIGTVNYGITDVYYDGDGEYEGILYSKHADAATITKQKTIKITIDSNNRLMSINIWFDLNSSLKDIGKIYDDGCPPEIPKIE